MDSIESDVHDVTFVLAGLFRGYQLIYQSVFGS